MDKLPRPVATDVAGGLDGGHLAAVSDAARHSQFRNELAQILDAHTETAGQLGRAARLSGPSRVGPSPSGCPPPELLTTAETAHLAGVGKRSLSRWSSSGQAPAPVKIAGTTVRYRRAEIMAWIAAGCPDCREWTYLA